ncbi:MAG: addiction module protein [Crocosphaera sp.]
MISNMISDPNIQKAWKIETKKRRDEILNGTVQPISGQEALEQVRQMIMRSPQFQLLQ